MPGAGFTSRLDQCPICGGVHGAVAAVGSFAERVAAVLAPPAQGTPEAVVAEARKRLPLPFRLPLLTKDDPYAKKSSYKDLTDPVRDDVSETEYREGAWKCNVFVGDVLAAAGYDTPLSTYNRYANAANLPSKPEFDQVTDLRDVQPGDVLVIDYPGSGPAHVEIITEVTRDADGSPAGMQSIGGREDGVTEDGSKTDKLLNGTRRGAYWERDGNRYYVLRPNRALPSANATTAE